MTPRPAYVGVDAAFAKRKPLPISICTWAGGRLVPEPLRDLGTEPPCGSGNALTLDHEVVGRFAREAADYVRRVCAELGLAVARIGIDAPSAPRRDDLARRTAEAALTAARISCFATPSAREFDAIRVKVERHLAGGGAENRIPHANQLWMLVGFALFRRLGELAPCIEVFPQATARVLGVGAVHKSKAGGVEEQLARAAVHTGWPTGRAGETRFDRIAWGPSHDRLDAYLSAWVAALPQSRRVAFGRPPDDGIWVPRLETGASDLVAVPTQLAITPAGSAGSGNRGKTKMGSDEPQVETTVLHGDHSRLCPACGRFCFRRWPWGWDGHAGWRCEGLAAGDPEERKEEFKRRFL